MITLWHCKRIISTRFKLHILKTFCIRGKYKTGGKTSNRVKIFSVMGLKKEEHQISGFHQLFPFNCLQNISRSIVIKNSFKNAIGIIMKSCVQIFKAILILMRKLCTVSLTHTPKNCVVKVYFGG